MPPRLFFEPVEYIGALVYDSVGLLYGRVCGVETSSTIALRICVTVETDSTVPDTEKLRSLLEARDVKVPQDAGLEALVSIARELGLDIPLRLVEEEVELVKSLVEPRGIAVVDRMEAGQLVVVLNEPREALFRGLPGGPAKPRLVPGLVEGKHVVSMSRGYLGTVKTIVIGAGGVGLRVVKKLSPYIAWFAFLTELERRGYTSLARRLAEEVADPLARKRLPVSETPRVRSVLDALSAPREAYQLLERSLRYEHEETHDVEWERVKSVGDAVITE